MSYIISFHPVRVLLSVQVVTEAQTAGSAAISLQPSSARCPSVQSVTRRNYCKVAVGVLAKASVVVHSYLRANTVLQDSYCLLL